MWNEFSNKIFVFALCRFAVMACCWAMSADERPKFTQLLVCLQEFYTALGRFIWVSHQCGVFLIIYFLSSSQISPWKEASSKHPPTPTHGGITVSIFNRYFKHNAFLCNFFFYKYNDLQRIFKANFYNINDSRTVIVSHVILSRNTSFCLITSLTVFCFMHDICHSHWI